jgi:small subunit ribosomal protein S20
MPNNKQAKKRVRQSELARIQNKSVRTGMRSAIKKVLQAGTAEDAKTLLPLAMKRIDKAAKNNVIHDNAAARYKSRLARRIAAKARA